MFWDMKVPFGLLGHESSIWTKSHWLILNTFWSLPWLSYYPSHLGPIGSDSPSLVSHSVTCEQPLLYPLPREKMLGTTLHTNHNFDPCHFPWGHYVHFIRKNCLVSPLSPRTILQEPSISASRTICFETKEI